MLLKAYSEKATVARENIFSLATDIYFNAKHYARLAKNSVLANDYNGYRTALRTFENFRDLIQNPVFAEWEYADELEHIDIPVYTISDWIADTCAPVFTDGSTVDVDDDCDVPF